MLWIKQRSDWKQTKQKTSIAKPYTYVHRMNQILVSRTFKRFSILIIAQCNAKIMFGIHVTLVFLICTAPGVNSVTVILSRIVLENKRLGQKPYS